MDIHTGKPPMLKALQIEPEKCTGCLQCELACSYEIAKHTIEN
jgi:Fe-S-cluster-containing dehydrogenase component